MMGNIYKYISQGWARPSKFDIIIPPHLDPTSANFGPPNVTSDIPKFSAIQVLGNQP